MADTRGAKEAATDGPTFHRYKRTRYWAVRNGDGSLLAVTVYRKGALAIINRIMLIEAAYSLTEAGRRVLEEAPDQ